MNRIIGGIVMMKKYRSIVKDNPVLVTAIMMFVTLLCVYILTYVRLHSIVVTKVGEEWYRVIGMVTVAAFMQLFVLCTVLGKDETNFNRVYKFAIGLSLPVTLCISEYIYNSGIVLPIVNSAFILHVSAFIFTWLACELLLIMLLIISTIITIGMMGSTGGAVDETYDKGRNEEF